MRALVLMMVVFFTMTLTDFTAIAQEDENLVRNPDFEDGIIGWELELHGDQGAAATLTTDKDGVVGKLCALVETQSFGGGTWWHTGLNQTGHAVEDGVTYTLSFWAKSETERIISACMAENHDPWGNWNMQDFTITMEWQEYSLTWTSATIDPNARIRISMGQAKEAVWVDHVRLYEGDYVEEDIEGFTEQPVKPASSLATTWASVKAH